MKDKLEEIQKSLETLVAQISDLKAELEWLKNQETLIIPSNEFKNIKLKSKKENYLLYDFQGVSFVLGTSGTENIKERLLSGDLDYLVLKKLKKPTSWNYFIQTHEVLKEEEAVLNVLYP